MDNTVDGDVSGQVFQFGSISGGVHHHHHPAPAAPRLPLRVGLVPLRAASFQERAPGDQLKRALAGGATAVLVADTAPATVLSGMGGVGKTQLAADHAERAWANGEVELLVWVTATSREAIASGYADAAAALAGGSNLDPEHGARTLLEWLATATAPWLVVLDDLQTPADLTGLWPPTTDCGRTVVTTRRRDAALRGYRRQVVEVGAFSEAEALAYLSTAFADHPILLDGAEALVHDLGFLPLALAQAGAYMLDRRLSCNQYRVRLTQRRLVNVVPAPEELPDEHRTTLAATWSLSVEQANLIAPEGMARPLLDLASMLDPNGIPVTVFTTPAALKYLTTAVGRLVDEHDAWDGLLCLNRLSLVTLDTNSPSREVQAHALVQRATRDAWPDDRATTAALAAADALYEAWPMIQRDAVFAHVLRANADALAEADNGSLWRHGGHPLQLRAGRSRGSSGLLNEAKSYFTELRTTADQQLGPDHPHTLSIRHEMASWQNRSGDPEGAVIELEQVLDARNRVLGPDHPETLRTRNELGLSRGGAGDAAGAADTFQSLLADRTRVLGADHPHTLATRGNLAVWRGRAGEPWWAVAALEQLLPDRLRVNGADHPQTLITRSNLASWRGWAGDPAGAAAAYELLLEDRIRLLGPHHPDTLVNRHNLAHWRGQAGDPNAAAAAFEELLADRVHLFGPEHPHILLTRQNLTYWRRIAGITVD